jgi:glycosyltransferase involved in cell wall biosynthesis
VQFGLVGGGTSLEEMKALAFELGIADYVTFTGRVPDQPHCWRCSTRPTCA